MNNKEKVIYLYLKRKKAIIILCFVYINLFICSEEFFRGYFSNVKSVPANYNISLSAPNLGETTDEVGLYISQSRVSPFSILPADDEKNVGQSKGKNKIPIHPKEVYLTFDDGPSKKNTLAVLDILNKNNVKATFFIVGELAEANKDVIMTMKDSGMCILPHAYTHDYAIYKSQDRYFEDLNHCISVIESITGEEVPPYMRMPGGSDNQVGKREIVKNIRVSLKEKNIRYVDWNVSSLDASGNSVPASTIRKSVINGCKNNSLAVVLMHDANAKATTVEALPEIIRNLKENGYVFRTFQDITEEEEKEMIKRRIIYR